MSVQFIKTFHLGMPHPLMKAKEFVLSLCSCTGVPIQQFPKCSVMGVGYIAPGIEYKVEIAIDDDEIHAYFRYARPSMWRFPVVEIVFSSDENLAHPATPA